PWRAGWSATAGGRSSSLAAPRRRLARRLFGGLPGRRLRDIAAKARRWSGHDLPPLADPDGPHHRRPPPLGGALAQAGPVLLAASATPYDALGQWVSLFVDFLVTKLGLAAALQSDDGCFDSLHSYFLDRLVPVCTQLPDAAAGSGEIRSDLDAYGLMR